MERFNSEAENEDQIKIINNLELELKKDKFEHIVSFCIVDFAIKNIDTLRGYDSIIYDRNPDDFKEDSDLQISILIAAKNLKYSLDSITMTLARYKDMKNYFERYTEVHGKDTYVRISIKACLETKLSKKAYEKFAVHCAVKAILGKNVKAKFKRITMNRIEAAATDTNRLKFIVMN